MAAINHPWASSSMMNNWDDGQLMPVPGRAIYFLFYRVIAMPPASKWDQDDQRFYAMHHPFTSPKKEDMAKLGAGDPEVLGSIRADAYDLVINGAEIGGGSIRIHNKELQLQNLRTLGFSEEEARAQFGFLMDAFEYGTPPHGGIAFGFDRLVAVMAGQSSIRDFIAFPKNNQGRDMMIDAPSTLEQSQWSDLHLRALEKPDSEA